MPLIVDLIEDLRRRQAVYPVDDSEFEDLYFAQGSDPDFGSLAHLSEEQAVAIFAERGGDPDRGGKKAPLDCLVWLHARAGAELGVRARRRTAWVARRVHRHCPGSAGAGLRCSGWRQRSDLSAP